MYLVPQNRTEIPSLTSSFPVFSSWLGQISNKQEKFLEVYLGKQEKEGCRPEPSKKFLDRSDLEKLSTEPKADENHINLFSKRLRRIKPNGISTLGASYLSEAGSWSLITSYQDHHQSHQLLPLSL